LSVILCCQIQFYIDYLNKVSGRAHKSKKYAKRTHLIYSKQFLRITKLFGAQGKLSGGEQPCVRHGTDRAHYVDLKKLAYYCLQKV